MNYRKIFCRIILIAWSTVATIGALLHMPSECLSSHKTIPMRLREECTIGLANGDVTEDGRPILWKVRDISAARQQLVHVSSYPYDYIGVRSEGDSVRMGLNEAGVATGKSHVETPGGEPSTGLVSIDKLSVRTIVQGNDSANDYEFIRYGPDRSLSTISRSSTTSAMAVHGVAPNEDPRLATGNFGANKLWYCCTDVGNCFRHSGEAWQR